MESKEKRLERYQTLGEYMDEFGAPWTIGTARGDLVPAVAEVVKARHMFDRLAIPRDSSDYSARVRGMFDFVALTDFYSATLAYQKRDAVLGDSVKRETKRTEYAAPNGAPSTAYSTGMEVVEDTAPMHENVDRALSVQDGWKEVYTEAAKAFDRCFLGVVA